MNFTKKSYCKICMYFFAKIDYKTYCISTIIFSNSFTFSCIIHTKDIRYKNLFISYFYALDLVTIILKKWQTVVLVQKFHTGAAQWAIADRKTEYDLHIRLLALVWYILQRKDSGAS